MEELLAFVGTVVFIAIVVIVVLALIGNAPAQDAVCQAGQKLINSTCQLKAASGN